MVGVLVFAIFFPFLSFLAAFFFAIIFLLIGLHSQGLTPLLKINTQAGSQTKRRDPARSIPPEINDIQNEHGREAQASGRKPRCTGLCQL